MGRMVDAEQVIERGWLSLFNLDVYVNLRYDCSTSITNENYIELTRGILSEK